MLVQHHSINLTMSPSYIPRDLWNNESIFFQIQGSNFTLDGRLEASGVGLGAVNSKPDKSSNLLLLLFFNLQNKYVHAIYIKHYKAKSHSCKKFRIKITQKS